MGYKGPMQLKSIYLNKKFTGLPEKRKKDLSTLFSSLEAKGYFLWADSYTYSLLENALDFSETSEEQREIHVVGIELGKFNNEFNKLIIKLNLEDIFESSFKGYKISASNYFSKDQ